MTTIRSARFPFQDRYIASIAVADGVYALCEGDAVVFYGAADEPGGLRGRLRAHQQGGGPACPERASHFHVEPANGVMAAQPAPGAPPIPRSTPPGGFCPPTRGWTSSPARICPRRRLFRSQPPPVACSCSDDKPFSRLVNCIHPQRTVYDPPRDRLPPAL